MKIATIGNCQSGVIAKIMEKRIDNCHMTNFNISDCVGDDSIFKVEDYDVVFLQNALGVKFRHFVESLLPLEKVFGFPNIIFSGLQPDYTYIDKMDGTEKASHQSGIIFNGYVEKLDKSKVKSLFNHTFYDLLNYNSVFETGKSFLINSLHKSNMDGEFLFEKWLMGGSFMYTMNHPHLRVLDDVASCLIQKANLKLKYTGNIQHVLNDPLKEFCIFPTTSVKVQDYSNEQNFIYKIGEKLFSLEALIDHYYKFYDHAIDTLKVNEKNLTSFKEALNKYEENIHTKSCASNPYKNKPKSSMWRRSVATVDPTNLAPLSSVNPIIDKTTKVATAGSCFAQHIARTLAKNGLNYYVAEQIPQGLTDEIAQLRGYDLFSARYGNIYTARQLVQLFKRAYGHFVPDEQTWLAKSGQYIDPFRPNISEEFETEAELIAQRAIHLAAVREMFENLNVFVFTLGLTESWLNTHDGAVYPVAPGVVSQHSNYSNYVFKNFTHEETREDMIEFLGLLRSVNRDAKVLLTVSPVPLIATYEDEHVLSATTYSKSVLRAVAGELTKAFEFVSYFPSYEIITGSFNKGAYYESDLRSVKPEGVAHVMGVFMDYMVAENGVIQSEKKKEDIVDQSLLVEIEKNSDIVCDEELIDSE